jgi:hypothetical protein
MELAMRSLSVAIAVSILALSGGVPAHAKTARECLSAYSACKRVCADRPTVGQYASCTKSCRGGLSKCGDALPVTHTSPAATTKTGDGKKPPGNVLDGTTGFNSQAPASTGKPKSQTIR